MPDECVAADLHVVAECEIDDTVGLREVEGLGIGAKDLPFEGIFGLEHVELASQRLRISGFRKLGWANGSADEDAGVFGGEAQSGRLRRRGQYAQARQAATGKTKEGRAGQSSLHVLSLGAGSEVNPHRLARTNHTGTLDNATHRTSTVRREESSLKDTAHSLVVTFYK